MEEQGPTTPTTVTPPIDQDKKQPVSTATTTATRKEQGTVDPPSIAPLFQGGQEVSQPPLAKLVTANRVKRKSPEEEKQPGGPAPLRQLAAKKRKKEEQRKEEEKIAEQIEKVEAIDNLL